MNIIDPGHCYILNVLDKDVSPEFYINEQLVFVKRVGDKYPGNARPYPGTTIQEVCRALIDRLKYVNNQEWCSESDVCITYLRKVIIELEVRAAKRHKRGKLLLRHDVENEPTCKICGHIQCEETCRGGNEHDKHIRSLPEVPNDGPSNS